MRNKHPKNQFMRHKHECLSLSLSFSFSLPLPPLSLSQNDYINSMLIIQISISRPTSFIVISTMFASNYIVTRLHIDISAGKLAYINVTLIDTFNRKLSRNS